MSRSLILFLLCIGLTQLLAQLPSPFIHVDQFGYLPERTKVAVISDPQVGYNSDMSFTPSANIQVWDYQTGTRVMEVPVEPWNGGTIHEQSGDRGWWVDFSSLATQGEYYLLDSASGERSAVFLVSDTVYAPVLRAVGRTFYFNRCNAPKPAAYAGLWADGVNFNRPTQDIQCRYIYAPTDLGQAKDLSGGWFDAASYNKYVAFSHSTLYNLLAAYEANPEVFTDDWNLPESGNGIPDLIDEIKWELDWLLKMVNPDGSVHIKVGSQYWNDNSASPPSANTNSRYYGPTCSSASIMMASIMARSVRVFAQFPSLASYAQELAQTAQTCFAYSRTFVDNNTFETDCDDGSIPSADTDVDAELQLSVFLTAAIYLYELTGDSLYRHYVSERGMEIEQMDTGYWGAYRTSTNEALVQYLQQDTLDPRLANRIIQTLGGSVIYNDYFGFRGQDLYRAYIPDWSYHWGSNQVKANYALINQMVVNSGIATNVSSLEQYVDEMIHYFHGVNPLGLVYLSNMYEQGAERSVNQLFHDWFAEGTVFDHALDSPVGPPPGFVVRGPNPYFSVASISPPYGQPLQKSYLDYNTGWPDNAWEVSEPTIAYQAAYLRLIATRTRLSLTNPVSLHSPLTQAFELYPNPAQQVLHLRAPEPISQVEIWSIDGKVIKKGPITGETVDVGALPHGVYILRANGKYVQRFTK